MQKPKFRPEHSNQNFGKMTSKLLDYFQVVGVNISMIPRHMMPDQQERNKGRRTSNVHHTWVACRIVGRMTTRDVYEWSKTDSNWQQRSKDRGSPWTTASAALNVSLGAIKHRRIRARLTAPATGWSAKTPCETAEFWLYKTDGRSIIMFYVSARTVSDDPNRVSRGPQSKAAVLNTTWKNKSPNNGVKYAWHRPHEGFSY